MNNEKLDKLVAYWHSDKQNEALLADLLLNISQCNNFEIFRDLYSQVSFAHIHSEQVHAQSVELLIRAGEQATAQQHLLDYKAPLGEWYFHFKALMSLMNAHFEDCIQILSVLDENNELPASSITLLARANYLNGDVNAAQSVLAKYLPLYPSPEVLGLYAMCLLDLEQHSESEKLALQALELQANQLDALIAKASCDVAKLDMQSATKYVEMALEANSMIGRVWSLVGQIDLYNAHYQSAAQAFDKAIELMPDHIGTFHLSAWVSLILGDIDKAQTQFSQALDLNPNFADSHAGLAIVAVNKQQIDEAQKLVKKSLRLDPNSFTARYAQSLLTAQQGNEEQAKAQIEQIINSESSVNAKTYSQLIEKAVKDINARAEGNNEH